VDDDLSVVESYGGFRVVPFEGDPRDEELLKVPEAVDASGGVVTLPQDEGAAPPAAPTRPTAERLGALEIRYRDST
jgi:hypothetical protein